MQKSETRVCQAGARLTNTLVPDSTEEVQKLHYKYQQQLNIKPFSSHRLLWLHKRGELVVDVSDADGEGAIGLLSDGLRINPSAFQQTAQISSEPNQPLI